MKIKKLFDRLQIVDLLENYFTNVKFSDDIIHCVRRRCQKLVFGVFVDCYKYHKEKEYSKLKGLLKKKLFYLKESTYIPHKIAYISFKMIGITFSGYLLSIIKENRNM